MQAYKATITFTNSCYIIVGIIYIVFVWHDRWKKKRDEQRRWGQRKTHVLYTALGIFVVFMSSLLVVIPGYFSYLMHTIYMVVAGLLCYIFAWPLYAEIYAIDGPSPEGLSRLSIIRMVVTRLSGVMLASSLLWLSIALGFPINVIASEYPWFVAVFFTVAICLVLLVNINIESAINYHVHRRKEKMR